MDKVEIFLIHTIINMFLQVNAANWIIIVYVYVDVVV